MGDTINTLNKNRIKQAIPAISSSFKQSIMGFLKLFVSFRGHTRARATIGVGKVNPQAYGQPVRAKDNRKEEDCQRDDMIMK